MSHEITLRRRPRREAAAAAAYATFWMVTSRIGPPGKMPPWDALPDEAKADWRAVADAVIMMMDMPE